MGNEEKIIGLKIGDEVVIIQFSDYKVKGTYNGFKSDKLIEIIVYDNKLKAHYSYFVNIDEVKAIKRFHKEVKTNG